jgi:hypothetical protein
LTSAFDPNPSLVMNLKIFAQLNQNRFTLMKIGSNQ